jgi:hypothetical protein
MKTTTRLSLLVVTAFASVSVARAETRPPAGSGSTTDMGTPSGNINDVVDRSTASPPASPDVSAPPSAPVPAAPGTMTPPPAQPPGTTNTEVEMAPTTTVPQPPLPNPTTPIEQNRAETTGASVVSVPVEPLPPLMPPGNNNAHPAAFGKIGGALLVGGGYEDFTNSTLNHMTSGGGAWNARVVAGTRQFVGLEAAYVGAARSIESLGLSNNASLVSNGLEGTVRVNIPIVRRASLIEPFGFAGLGWSHYHIGNTTNLTSDLLSNDDVMTVPFGGGLEYGYKAFIADARFTYRQTYYNDLVRTGGGNLNNWGVGGQIGFSY